MSRSEMSQDGLCMMKVGEQLKSFAIYSHIYENHVPIYI